MFLGFFLRENHVSKIQGLDLLSRQDLGYSADSEPNLLSNPETTLPSISLIRSLNLITSDRSSQAYPTRSDRA